jgi:hypothetical protein
MLNCELEFIPLSLTLREMPALGRADNATRAIALVKFLMLGLCYRCMAITTRCLRKGQDVLGCGVFMENVNVRLIVS